MLQKGKKILIFPVETIVRELDFRLILAVLCARPGWQVLVGDHEHLFRIAIHLENAVQVLKNLTGGKRPWKYRRYKELGHRIVQLDEEGAIYEGGHEAWRAVLDKRLDVRALDAEDHVCTWGPFQADHYRSHKPACAARIHATGHPRLDLGKPRFREIFREEAAALRARHGDFILINTNLVSNNALGPDVLLRHYRIRPEDVANRTHRIEQYAHEARRHARFIQLINHLSNRFPDMRIVVRPHPSEDIRIYQTLLRHIPRAETAREGSLHAWLLAAKVLIHGGCTTAIEAHLCGTPIVNFHPIHDSRFEVTLPNLLGVSCSTVDEAATAVRAILDGAPPPPPAEGDLAMLREMIGNFDTDGDAFRALAEVIGNCQDAAVPARYTGGPLPMLLIRLKDWRSAIARSSRRLRRLFRSRDRGFDKFPPFDKESIRRKIAIITRIENTPVTLRFHGSRVLSITRD